MRIEPLDGSDVRLVHPDRHGDERGWFARVWCADTFAAAGLEFAPVQANSSLTRGRGTVRGMHGQRPPFTESKLVRCAAGRMFDVVVDLRPGSARRGQVVSVELSAAQGAMLYVPAGFAHGFQSLSDELGVDYLMGDRYDPARYDGFRYDDPAVGIRWPLPVTMLSDRDRNWPPLSVADGAWSDAFA